MAGKTLRSKYSTDLKIARKEGAKIASFGTYVDYDSLYIKYNGKEVAVGVVDLIPDCIIKGTPKDAKQNGYDVVRLSKTESEKQIFLYTNKEGVCAPINLQICDEFGNIISFLPCQQYDVEDFVTSPLLEKITKDTALIKMHLTTTEKGTTVVEATYLNLNSRKRSSRIVAIKDTGKTYDVTNSIYMTKDADKKANVKKHHENLPLLAKVSLYGEDFLNPLLKEIRKSYKSYLFESY